MKNIAIVGLTLSGNMGGQAMLMATLEAMQQRSPGCHLYLLSVYPEADKRLNKIADLTIISAHAFLLIGLYLPLSLIIWPFVKLPAVRLQLAHIPYFKALLGADMVIDLCGISFVDGRGLPLLVYNTACCLPAIILGTPIVKLAQAVGPFKKLLNRSVAKFILHRCAFVIARGEYSLKNLTDLDIDNAMILPDVAFALEVPEAAAQQANNILVAYAIKQKPFIVSPSRVVERLCAKAGVDFIDEMTALLTMLAERGESVIILPHSFVKGPSKNNDVSLCKAILNQLPQGSSVQLIDDIEDAEILRSIIGKARLFLGCRFHTIVAALAMGVPCIAIGWGHKYTEMMAAFGLADWVFDISGFSSETLLSRIQELEKRESEVRKQIQTTLPTIRKQAVINFDIASQVLNRCGHS